MGAAGAQGRRVLIVGASVGGVRCATALRSAGFTGSITLIDAEEEIPYDKPQLSKRLGPGAKFDTLIDEQELRAHEIEFLPGTRAEGLDLAAGVVESSRGRLDYDELVIATGCRPRQLGAALPAAAGYVRTRADWLRLREAVGPGRRLVVLGGGFLGLESAAAARVQGMEAVVVDVADQVLTRGIPRAAAAVIAGRHIDEGVELRLGASAPTVTGDGHGVRVDDVNGDFAVVSIGAVPNIEWLDGSGLLLDRGVVCDSSLAAAPGVWAIGDCARWLNPRYGELERMEHWTTAVNHAQRVASAIVTGVSAPVAEVPYVWSDQFDWRIQTAGRVGGETAHHILPTGGHLFISISEGAVTGVTTINAQALCLKARRMLREADPSLDEMASALGVDVLEPAR